MNEKTIELVEKLPLHRTAYSDRIALLMAKLSDLAYLDNGEDFENELNSLGFDLVKYIDKENTEFFFAECDDFYVLAFRGTQGLRDILTDANILNFKRGKDSFHSGFKKAYEKVQSEVEELVENVSKPIYVTGHSLGGALAIIACNESINSSKVASCYTFGCPSVGDSSLDQNVLKFPIYRVVNNVDIFPRVPPWNQGSGFLVYLTSHGTRVIGQSAAAYMKLSMWFMFFVGISLYLTEKILSTRGKQLHGLGLDHKMNNYIEKLQVIAEDRQDINKQDTEITKLKRLKNIFDFVYFALAVWGGRSLYKIIIKYLED